MLAVPEFQPLHAVSPHHADEKREKKCDGWIERRFRADANASQLVPRTQNVSRTESSFDGFSIRQNIKIVRSSGKGTDLGTWGNSPRTAKFAVGALFEEC